MQKSFVIYTFVIFGYYNDYVNYGSMLNNVAI